MNLKIKSITLSLLLLLWFQTSAQDLILESQVIQAGQDVEYIASRFIYSNPANPFVVENGGTVKLNAGYRIELHPGFTTETGAILYASVDNLTPGETDKEERTYVFPNPTPGVFTIHTTQIMDAVRLLDANGNIVQEKDHINSVDFAMDITKVQVGYYILEVVSGKLTDKIRIQKE